MAEVQYTDLPDTQKQQIDNTVKVIFERNTPTLNSFTKNTKVQSGGQQGWQIAFIDGDYGQNSYLSPGSLGNSFASPVAPTSISMWVGTSYQGMVLNTDGTFMDTMDKPASLINEAKLRDIRIRNFMKTQNYYAIGDNFGYGIVAVTTSNTGGTFTGVTAASTVAGYTKGAHRLLKGVTYDVVDESSLAVVGTMTPTANGTNSATVTCTTTGSVNNSGAFVVEQGAFNKVPRGLAYLINNTARTFQGVDTTGISEFNSSVVDLNGSAITSATLNTLKAYVQIRANVDTKEEFKRIGHLPPGQYTTLANQGFSGRQYQAADGGANTTYGYPERYVDGDIMWVCDADMDEDRVYLRRADDYFRFELKPFSMENKDGLEKRQAPGLNNVGAAAYYSQMDWFYNLGFNGDATGGNYSSAFIQRAQINYSQINAI